jgi:formylglycine-generating enzyme required for sulfatase activity
MPPDLIFETYEAFELLIGSRTADGYPVTITRAPAGDAKGLCRLDPAHPDFQSTLAQLENEDLDETRLQNFGRCLFEALFDEEVGSVYRSSLGQVRGYEAGLRVRLRLEAPELGALPWEYLYDPEEDRFLAISPETPVVRYVPMRSATRPTAVTPPLRLLVVISNPGDIRDAQPLDVAQERSIIQAALRERVDQGLVQLRLLDRAVVAEMTQAMRNFRPHVFHFVGHGQFEADQAFLMLEDEDGCALPMGELAFREFFLGTSEARVAVLNACQTATTSSARPLAGLAPRILQRDLSAVVAMQYPILDHAALVFSREFYRSLALGYPVDAAVAEARKGIFLEVGGDVRDWGIPVLFLRAQDGQLFDIEALSEQIHLDLLKPEISRLAFEPETVLVPAGAFLMGSLDAEEIPDYEMPQHQVDLPAYRIGVYPVTNEQYAEFVKDADYAAPKKVGWFGKSPPKDKLDHPVVGVSWYDAGAYCRWLSDKTGRVYRLPAEAEWEKAARGTDGQIYPWGDEWDASRCNCSSTQTTPVTAYPSSQSPHGCYDMAGNVWEWTTTLWGSDWKSPDFSYPYQSDDGREDLKADETVHRLFRGGSFEDDVAKLRSAARRWYAPDHADKARGFRVALEIHAQAK